MNDNDNANDNNNDNNNDNANDNDNTNDNANDNDNDNVNDKDNANFNDNDNDNDNASSIVEKVHSTEANPLNQSQTTIVNAEIAISTSIDTPILTPPPKIRRPCHATMRHSISFHYARMVQR